MVERSQQEVWRLTPWLAIVLCLGNFMLMAFDAREINSGQRIIRVWAQTAADFVQSPVTTITSSVSGYFGSIANLRSAQSENDELKQRVQELEVQLMQSEALTTENERLRGLLQLKDESKIDVLSARIIGRDPSIFFDSSIINRGSLDGVKINMPIVTGGGLVGRVTAVSPLTAQVDLISRDKSGVGAAIGETGALGVIIGSSKSDVLDMRYVAGSVAVAPGQIVYTSGQDGIYPAGLKIGEIVEVKSGSATVTHQIFVKPSAGIGSMREVGILLYEADAKPEFEQKLTDPKKKK